MEKAFGAETLKVINDLHQKRISRYVVLMRHAERPIDTAENDLFMQLTEAGKQAAYEFGQALPPDSLIRFFSSPVDRCVETSTLIEKGCLSSGKKTQTNTELDSLYAFFIKDLLKVDGMLYEMLDAGEWAKFFRNWFDGKYVTDIIGNASQAAQTLLNALLELLQGPAAGGNICISHDINLFLIKEYYLGLRPEDNEYIQFLEGVILYEWDGRYYIVNHQTEAKLLPAQSHLS
ncbi:MAG TPA: histidine phosphatase family protein [Caldilineae bacterium]|nr:histidine phosphatase family protein [Caldilineae bacterium]